MNKSKAIGRHCPECSGGSPKKAVFFLIEPASYVLSGWDLRLGTSGKPMGVGLGLIGDSSRGNKARLF